jgi:hypothetical protein
LFVVLSASDAQHIVFSFVAAHILVKALVVVVVVLATMAKARTWAFP